MLHSDSPSTQYRFAAKQHQHDVSTAREAAAERDQRVSVQHPTEWYFIYHEEAAARGMLEDEVTDALYTLALRVREVCGVAFLSAPLTTSGALRTTNKKDLENPSRKEADAHDARCANNAVVSSGLKQEPMTRPYAIAAGWNLGGASTSKREHADITRHRLGAVAAERYGRLHAESSQRDEDNERADREHFAAVAREEAAAAREAAERRDAGVRQRRIQQDSFRAAATFIAARETEARQVLASQYQKTVVPTLWALKEKTLAEGKACEHEAFLNTDEQRQLAAQRDREVADAKAAAAKKKAEFNKEQDAMKNNCKHSRSGTSVFVGPLAKKICLMCKVKYDEKNNIFIRLR